MTTSELEKEELAGAVWLALLTSKDKDKNSLLNLIERLIGSDYRRKIEAALESMRRE